MSGKKKNVCLSDRLKNRSKLDIIAEITAHLIFRIRAIPIILVLILAYIDTPAAGENRKYKYTLENCAESEPEGLTVAFSSGQAFLITHQGYTINHDTRHPKFSETVTGCPRDAVIIRFLEYWRPGAPVRWRPGSVGNVSVLPPPSVRIFKLGVSQSIAHRLDGVSLARRAFDESNNCLQLKKNLRACYMCNELHSQEENCRVGRNPENIISIFDAIAVYRFNSIAINGNNLIIYTKCTGAFPGRKANHGGTRLCEVRAEIDSGLYLRYEFWSLNKHYEPVIEVYESIIEVLRERRRPLSDVTPLIEGRKFEGKHND